MEDLLKIRKKMKAKKPNFIRQDAHKKAEISKKWRKARGLQSKMRLCKKGYRRSPSKGYRTPAAVRGLHESGVSAVVVYSKKDLEQIKDEGAIIAASVVGNCSCSRGNISHIYTRSTRIGNPTIFYPEMFCCPPNGYSKSSRTSNIPISNDIWIIDRSSTSTCYNSQFIIISDIYRILCYVTL